MPKQSFSLLLEVGTREPFFLKKKNRELGKQNGLHRSCQFNKLPAGAYKNIKQTLQLKTTIDGGDSIRVNGYWEIRDYNWEESSRVQTHPTRCS